MKKETVYLAGKITGDPSYFHKFYEAQKKLEAGGFIVVNPALLRRASPTKRISVCRRQCSTNVRRLASFQIGSRATARRMSSGARRHRESASLSMLHGRRSRKRSRSTLFRREKQTRSLSSALNARR